jgi:hypothetical protein
MANLVKFVEASVEHYKTAIACGLRTDELEDHIVNNIATHIGAAKSIPLTEGTAILTAVKSATFAEANVTKLGTLVHDTMLRTTATMKATRCGLQSCDHIDDYLTEQEWSMIEQAQTLQDAVKVLVGRFVKLNLLNPTERTVQRGIATIAILKRQADQKVLLTLSRQLKEGVRQYAKSRLQEAPTTYPVTAEEFRRVHARFYDSAYGAGEGPVPSKLDRFAMAKQVLATPCRVTKSGCSAASWQAPPPQLSLAGQQHQQPAPEAAAMGPPPIPALPYVPKSERPAAAAAETADEAAETEEKDDLDGLLGDMDRVAKQVAKRKGVDDTGIPADHSAKNDSAKNKGGRAVKRRPAAAGAATASGEGSDQGVDGLPQGWTSEDIKRGTGGTYKVWYSPEGRRFRSLKEAREWISR